MTFPDSGVKVEYKRSTAAKPFFTNIDVMQRITKTNKFALISKRLAILVLINEKKLIKRKFTHRLYQRHPQIPCHLGHPPL
ncbi:MAG: hypothetical protein A2032_04780 [Chloroflexi bacterium RBG_19FT_COMBO_49_13]|nr:MAG: hypothetical protein A2032_04780 [Chloroflexi bacterium RBG_19FT_COMBO_49_13]